MYNRVLRELNRLHNTWDQCYFLRSLKTDDDDYTRWNVVYATGHELQLTFTHAYPHEPPIIDFDDAICIDIHHGDWSPVMTGMDIILSIYVNMELEQRKLRWVGLLRCIPMLMLWRKRATERLYHPSRIDFTAWVDD